MNRYIEKTGISPKEAIVILGAKNDFEAVSAEYKYLEKKFGKLGKDWDLVKQSLIHDDDKYYDRFHLLFSNGDQKVIYFDITEFFGKY